MRRGQLFLIEVIIALSVLIILITTLFASQNFTPPVSESALQEQGEEAINVLVDSGLIYKYLWTANNSFYTVGDSILSSLNENKTEVVNTIESVLPIIANFKVFTYRYNAITTSWDRVDIINFELNTPAGGEIVFVEYYSPGFNGVFDEYRFSMALWYEVDL